MQKNRSRRTARCSRLRRGSAGGLGVRDLRSDNAAIRSSSHGLESVALVRQSAPGDPLNREGDPKVDRPAARDPHRHGPRVRRGRCRSDRTRGVGPSRPIWSAWCRI